VRLNRLDAYVVAICVVGTLVALTLIPASIHLTGQLEWAQLITLGIILTVGELRPIRISHGDGSVDEVTISSSFTLAMVLQGPLIVAIVAQGIATLLDDVRQRKDVRRIAFNQAQYVLTLTASRAAFATLTQQGIASISNEFVPKQIPAALIAAFVFFAVNHILTTVAVAFARGENPLLRLPVEVRYHATTSGVLLALAPVVVIAVEFSPFMLALLIMPIAAVHKSASMAIRRETEALHDMLTGLANRAFLHQRAAVILDEAVRLGSGGTAVLLIDLDHFKEINDTLGHHIGDGVIVEAAQRLSSACETSSIVARLGGDEFAVVAVDLDVTEAEGLAMHILDQVTPPMVIEGVRIDLGASIGIAMAPEDGENLSTLLRHADVALYSAKEERNTFRRYAPEDDDHSVERLALLGELRDGLLAGEVLAHYQPKCDATTGEIVSVEALARWNHPRRGFVSPDEFIPIAENSGAIGQITTVILRQALEQLREWRVLYPGLTVAVNISPRQLSDGDLVPLVTATLAEMGLPPSALTLEVTESTAFVTSARTLATLHSLRRLGVNLSIDDFGSGATSLQHLSRLAPTELKIDKSFVLGLDDADNMAIVRSTIELGHALGLLVVAEGVENDAIWQRLIDMGCDVVQGFHLSRPVSALATSLLLAEPPRRVGAATSPHTPQPRTPDTTVNA
jgi:diguanylate cyclase (GGDEF)-like protein